MFQYHPGPHRTIGVLLNKHSGFSVLGARRDDRGKAEQGEDGDRHVAYLLMDRPSCLSKIRSP